MGESSKTVDQIGRVPTTRPPGVAFPGEKINPVVVIAYYETLREACYNLARENDGARMGGYKWLRFAMIESDIELSPAIGSIHCSGTCFSSQTQDNEYFEFSIPWEEMPEEFMR